jgi:imidazolonepropionase-like amidohydrolase
MFLHADTISENGTAAVGTCRIDSNDPDSAILTAVVSRKLVNECALAGTRRTSEAKNARMAGVTKQCFEQVSRAGFAILYHADGARQGTSIAVAQAVDPWLKGGVQTFSVKHHELRR